MHVGFQASGLNTLISWERGQLAIDSSYLYAVETANGDSFAVYSLSTPSNPTFIRRVSTGTLPTGIAITANAIYIANETDNSIGVYTIADHSHPVLSKTISTSAGGPAALAIVNGVLVAAHRVSKKLEVFSLLDPLNPTSISLINSSSITPALVGPDRLEVYQKTLIVAHDRCAWTFGDDSDRCGISFVDFSDPTTPVVKSQITGGETGYFGMIGRFLISTSYYSSLTNPTENWLSITDISDPQNPVRLDSGVYNATGRTYSTVSGSSVDGRTTEADLRHSDLVTKNGIAYLSAGSEINYSKILTVDLRNLQNL